MTVWSKFFLSSGESLQRVCDWIVSHVADAVRYTQFGLPAVLATGAVGLGLVSWLLHRKQNLPPGPRGLPLLGAIFSVSEELHEDGIRWRNVYGDVVSFYVGPMLLVMLSGHEIIKEAFVRRGEDFSDRPQLKVHKLTQYQDDMFVGLFDETFKTNKKIASTSVRNFGIKSKVWADKTEAEISRVLQRMREKSGIPFDPQVIIMQALTTMAMHMVCSCKLEQDDPRIQEIADIFIRIFRIETEKYLFAIELLPIWLNKILFRESIEDAQTAFGNGRELLRKAYQEHKNNLDPENPRDIMDYYLLNRSSEEEDRVLTTILSFLPDSTESTTAVIMWAILFVTYDPEIQERLHDELDNVVGKSGIVSLEHKSQLVFLQAVIYESLRLGNPAPITIPHAAVKDTTLKGYNIPRHAMVIGNIHSVHNDTAIFPEPEKFRPGRFIDKEGKLINTEYVIPFGVGRRACIGESIAKAECLLFLGRLFHEFEFSFSPDNPSPSLEPIKVFGIFRLPQNFQVKVKQRK